MGTLLREPMTFLKNGFEPQVIWIKVHRWATDSLRGNPAVIGKPLDR